MKKLSLFILLALTLQIVHAGKPRKTIYFPEDTKTVFGMNFVKVGIGTKKDIKNSTFHTYYISTTKVSKAQFSSFLNDIKAEYEIAGIYKNNTCLLSDFRYIDACPVNWNYDSKKGQWIFTPKRFTHDPVGMVSTFGANRFCRWIQQETGKYVRLPKPIEYRPTLPQHIKKYIKKHKNLLSQENINTINSLNISNLEPGTEWTQDEKGKTYIMSYSRECPKELYIPMLLLSCTVAPILITVPIMMYVKVPMFRFTPVSSSDNTPRFPTAEPNLGFRLVIPDSVMP